MKFIITIICFTSIGYGALAQQQLALGDDVSYAVIKDTDGYVNVRNKPNNKASIIGKIHNYSIFNCEHNSSDWWKIIQTYENDRSTWLEGYINKSRVELLTRWKTIKSRNVYNDSCSFKTDSLIVIIKNATFKPQKHRLSFHPTQHYLSKIDGKRFWGTDGEVPRKKIISVKIAKNGVPIIIPSGAFNDLYEPTLKTLSVCKGFDNTFYILMVNSDGAGSYTIIWIIKENKYYSRYIDTSND